MRPSTAVLLELALPALRDYALILLDPGGKVVDWLCGAQDMFGYSLQDMAGKTLAGLFEPRDLAKGLELYELEVARRDSYSQDDRWHVRKDGTRIWVSGTVTALRQDGELRDFVKVLRDRTDLRIGAQARANELAQARAELQRIREFVRTLGHELRNPLSPIKHSALLLPRLSDDPKLLRVAETISNQTATLERLISDLMDISRLETGSMELRLVEVDVCSLLAAEAAAHAQQAAARKLTLEPLLPHAPVMVLGDPDRLRQAVGNLLANAIKYTPAGGSIWVKATQEGDDVAIRVQDTGMGIAPGALPRIFEIFTREDRAKSVAPGGLGVGLSIVRHIAALHGGVAQARSSGIGHGAEFTLRLPALGKAVARVQ